MPDSACSGYRAPRPRCLPEASTRRSDRAESLTPDLFPTDNDALVKATRDAQGRTVLAGIYGPSCPCAGDVFVARRNADGTPDTTFAGDGLLDVTTGAGDHVVRGIAIQPSGRILVMYDDSSTAPSAWLVQAITPAGVLVTADGTSGGFGTGGVLTVGPAGFGGGMAVDPTGRVVVAGESDNFDFHVQRFGENGGTDTTWNTTGARVTVDFAGGIGDPQPRWRSRRAATSSWPEAPTTG